MATNRDPSWFTAAPPPCPVPVPEGAVPMSERQRGEVPEAAVEAAKAERERVYNATGKPCATRRIIAAACDPALGDQRLVPLADLEPDYTFVVAELRSHERRCFSPWAGRLADEMEARARTFGGEPDER